MSAMAAVSREVIGHARPRIAPPVPARSDIAGLRAVASSMDIVLRPWQESAGHYLTALNADGLPLYREVCIVVARQNGKTHLAKPYIIKLLREGRKVMHIAQTRELPRLMFPLIAESLPEDLFLKRRGKGGKAHTIWPRYGSGSEEILLANGGSYRIAAANRGGPRGFTNDVVIIDELREMVSEEVMAAAESTTITSPHAQIVYLSNAGTLDSLVLNNVRDRAGKDPSLAYLEWSAGPDRAIDDVKGWAEANPSIGHDPMVMPWLEKAYRKHQMAGTLAYFETENLCRWVDTMRDRFVDGDTWQDCHAEALEPSQRTSIGISVAPEGTRASVVMAFQQSDGTVGMRQVFERTGNPVDLAALGEELRTYIGKRGSKVAFDPMTDGELVKYAKVVERVNGAAFTNASEQFVRLIDGRKLRWHEAPDVTLDLAFTARKEHDESGSFQAVRSSDDRPITAALAAIRAVWLASGPRTPRPKVY